MHILQKLILTLSVFPVTSQAMVTTCNIVEDQTPFNAQIISWDDKKNKAEVITGMDQKFEGVVTNSKDYEHAKKVNIYIK